LYDNSPSSFGIRKSKPAFVVLYSCIPGKKHEESGGSEAEIVKKKVSGGRKFPKVGRAHGAAALKKTSTDDHAKWRR